MHWLDTDDSVLMALQRGAIVVAANLDEHDAKLELPDGTWRVLFSSRLADGRTINDGVVVVPAETALILGET